MNTGNIKNNDPIQLQQTIIYFKAELAKYKGKVEKYKNNFDHSLIEKLEQENVHLTNDKAELSLEVYKLNKELERQTSDFKERIHLQEVQIKTSMNSINNLQKTKTDLRQMNKQLTEVIKTLKDGLNSDKYRNKKQDRQVLSLNQKLAEYKTTIEQHDSKLVELFQEANKKVYLKIEKLDISINDRIQSEEDRQYMIKEMEEKEKALEKLQHEIMNLTEQNEKYKDAITRLEKSLSEKNDGIGLFSSSSTPTIDSDMLLQLENQIKDVLGQSLDFEEKLAAKLIVINSLEHKLDQLTIEIDDIKEVRPID
ncbi:coiled-coil domain-containing protein [Paenisporosarcina antarctica]|uniref:Uncharacterized protein n=1 Tax=Paenisporosarcina antarctica TaxID=417367 RepID=A0A4P6ZUT4_9BACL|nr:hypothetical protein [Paenisporosarcina antarctica]QBP40081.1 hypothetical protein E2636_02440 [Paenisporosarcina antarctica]